MRDYKSLAEWLEAKGNPKHGIADGDDGNKVCAVESEHGMTLFSFKETTLPDGSKYFWISNGWGVNKEFFPAIKNFLNTQSKNESSDLIKFNIVIWFVDEDGEGEAEIGCLEAVSEYHAAALLRERVRNGRYPKDAWLDYVQNGKKISIDINGRRI